MTGRPQVRVGAIVRDGYQELEFWCPVLRFREAEGAATVTVIGESGSRAHVSELGYPVVPDKALAEVSLDDFDLVIVPGGVGAATDAMRGFLMGGRGKRPVLAAISHGVSVLATVGVIEGRIVAAAAAAREAVAAAGARCGDAPVVHDGDIVTAATTDDIPAFCRALVAAVLQTGN